MNPVLLIKIFLAVNALMVLSSIALSAAIFYAERISPQHGKI